MNKYKYQKADSPIAPKLFSQVSYLQCITTSSKYSCQSQEKKGKKQIETASEGYIVKDDIEYAYQNIIPLWMFGFVY